MVLPTFLHIALDYLYDVLFVFLYGRGLDYGPYSLRYAALLAYYLAHIVRSYGELDYC